MNERIQRQRPRSASSQADAEMTLSPAVAASTTDYDALLDEIDTLLETDAAAYVRGFVQKGGQ